ncbi:cysteine hydrolase family protein [Azonexus sp.]|jgi:nicotinamidase-related amidase|uniref:cysteine hydrolase family protein n=1 Tax=Azonexus sp. TaxID=1872668 RepID=UPI00281C08AB|nr:cysteine hydrolase family protein [Azonexus sp.]MDR1994388.1 cysteine hydrolase [Azonexus sp.]
MSARSLRQLVGVTPVFRVDGTLSVGKTALLLIDYQNEYCQGPLALPDEAAASTAACRLRGWAEGRGVTVIHVQHRVPAGSALFAAGSPGAEPLVGLEPGIGQTLIVKRLPSAFADTGLAEVLQRGAIDTLLIAGYLTHNCVDSTARDAFHRGYRVGIVADACATRDLPGADGATIPAAQVQAAVLAALGDRIAEIVDTALLATMAPA